MTPVLVYGICEVNYEITLDEGWLEENFPGMSVCTNEIVDEMQSVSIYGYILQLDQKTGAVSKVSAKQMEQIQTLYDMLRKHHKDMDDSHIGYFTALSGECDSDQEVYIIKQ